MFEKTPDHIKLLNSYMQQNEVWRNLGKAVTEVMNDMIDENRWALSRARQSEVVQRGDYVNTPSGQGKVTLVRRNRSNIDTEANTYEFEDVVEVSLPDGSVSSIPVRALQDRDTLIEQSKFTGFDYFSDVLQDDDYARIVDFIGGYWNESQHDNFVNFMGFIKRQRYEIDQLWTTMKDDPGDPTWTSVADSQDPATTVDEYDNLEPLGQGEVPIYESPNFYLGAGTDVAEDAYKYPTAHVQLSWDIIDYPTIDFIGVLSLFYLLAPIHLVLHRFVGSIYTEEVMRAGLGTQVHTINEASALWDNTAEARVSVAETTQVHAVNQGVVYIPFPLP